MGAAEGFDTIERSNNHNDLFISQLRHNDACRFGHLDTQVLLSGFVPIGR